MAPPEKPFWLESINEFKTRLGQEVVDRTIEDPSVFSQISAATLEQVMDLALEQAISSFVIYARAKRHKELLEKQG